MTLFYYVIAWIFFAGWIMLVTVGKSSEMKNSWKVIIPMVLFFIAAELSK